MQARPRCRKKHGYFSVYRLREFRRCQPSRKDKKATRVTKRRRPVKWFKHDSAASSDAKIEKLIIKYGLEGYGLYFYCLELIARGVEPHNLTFELEHDAEIIGHRVGMHHERVNEIMAHIIDAGLFENDGGRITCLKLATRTDEYTQKLIKSRQCPDSISIKSALIEENRIHKKKGKQNTGDKTTIKKSRPIRKEKPLSPKVDDLAEIIGLDKSAIEKYVDYRREAKFKKLTKNGLKLAAKKLVEYGGQNGQHEIVEQSMSNGWQGLFELKSQKTGRPMTERERASQEFEAEIMSGQKSNKNTIEGEYHVVK